ncbi:ABC transporter permease [Anaeroselena agilis]|uniref:ABC transporter permease n=1 Tax=Anaeroselena agilis TaxID=3063788 RepID=A0ABU3NU43_9FIRM|nr:ABC transporter permease [Selenomonadales bacterium 4137-cl]
MKLKQLCMVAVSATFLLYFVLTVSLAYFFSGTRFWEVLLSERMVFSIQLSILAATVSMGLAMLLAVPTAYALSRYEFFGKTLIDTMLELPMIVSPAAIGAMLLIFFNTPIGEWIQTNLQQFVFTVYGIVLAQFITVVGVAARMVKAALDEIPPRYEAVARTLGASSFAAFRTTTLPLCRRGIFAAAILTWSKAIGEFGATITVAGTMAMRTETLPISVYMRLAISDIEGAVISICILLFIGFSVLYAARLIVKRGTYA